MPLTVGSKHFIFYCWVKELCLHIRMQTVDHLKKLKKIHRLALLNVFFKIAQTLPSMSTQRCHEYCQWLSGAWVVDVVLLY